MSLKKDSKFMNTLGRILEGYSKRDVVAIIDYMANVIDSQEERITKLEESK